MGKVTADIRVADEVWIATALLHREHPDETDFALKRIESRLIQEDIAGRARPGVMPHISRHCVANAPRDRGRYRILFETGRSRRRLFRPGDPYHPSRAGGKAIPDRSAIPSKYHSLLDWYHAWAKSDQATDPLLALASRHRRLWRSTNADAYVRELREGFE